MQALAQDHGAERVRHDEAAIPGYQIARETAGNGERQPVAEHPVLGPFAVALEIRYRRFHLDDEENAVTAHAEEIGAASVRKRHLGEARVTHLREGALRAAAEFFGKVHGG